MSSIVFDGFVGPSYTAASSYLDCQRSINWYYESAPEKGAASGAAMLPTPGLLSLVGGSGQPIRGMYVPSSHPQSLYFVAGAQLNVMTMTQGSSLGPRTSVATTSVVNVGMLSTSTGPVSFSDNGTSLALVDGPFGYFVTFTGNVFSKIADPAFYGATRVEFVDGYFVFNNPGTIQFYISGLYATTFDALDFASKEGWPDNLVCCWANNRELWLFGQQTTEVWDANPEILADGTLGFPFQRNQGAAIQHGLKAPFSLARIGQTFAWLGTDERGQSAVWVANGYAPQRISTNAMDTTIAGYQKIDDAIAFSYRWRGHEFYQLTFPSADATWVFDYAEQQWHERLRMDSFGRFHRHQGTSHAYFAGGSVIGDYRTDILWEQYPGIYDCSTALAAYYEVIPRVRRSPHITSDRNRIRFDQLEIRFQPGVSGDRPFIDKPAALSNSPQAMLRWSNNGGATWSNEHWVSFGSTGEYNARAVWRNLGLSRDRVFEIRTTDPVYTVMVTAQLDLAQART